MLKNFRSAWIKVRSSTAARWLATGAISPPQACSCHLPIEQFADIKVKQDGKMINLYSYKHPANTNPPKAVVLMIHGYVMYMPYGFDYYAQEFSKHGICSIGIDQRGFGRSEGIKGLIESFDDLEADNVAFLEAARTKDPSLRNAPLFLMSHSMGGLACACINLHHPTLSRGTIMLSPPFAPTQAVMPCQSLTKYALPFLKPFRKCDVASFRREKGTPKDEVIANLKRDPCIYKGKTKLGFLISMKETSEMLMEKAKDLTTPHLIYHGASDKTGSVEGSKKFHAMMTAQDKTLHIIPNGSHDITFRKGTREKVAQEVVDWILKRISY